ncbi:hypothetical protein HMI54_015272 [Coelomomyces lativittatus]|nr:hypothetical protein HMI55_006167 [Coelomomyces lativittatus]KAJ1513045.1 hypothetical protein HMI54_015272 [Coelomomyces lativittatus]
MHPDLNLILIDTFLPTHDLWMVHLDPLESCLVFTVYPGGVFTHPYSSSTLKYRYLYPKGHSIRVAAMEYTTHVALVKTPMKPIPPPYTQIDILNLATSLRIMSLVLAEDPLVLVQLHFPSHIESHFQKTYFTPKGQRHLGMVAGYPYHLSFMYHSRTTPDICVAQHRFEFDQELLDIQWENSHIYVVSIHEHQVAYIWHGLQFQQLHRLVLNHEPEFPNSLLFMYGDTDPFYILTLNESTVLFHLSSSTSQFTFPPYLIPRDQHHDLDPHIVLWPPYFFFLTSDYYLLMYDFSHFPSFQPVRITCVDMYTQITHQPRSEKTSRELSRWFGDTKLLGFWITAHPTLSVWVHVHRKHLAKELYCVQAASQSSNQNDSRTHAS